MTTKKPGVHCVICGRLLRSEASKQKGVGRDCARKKRKVPSTQYLVLSDKEPMSDEEALVVVRRVAGLE